MKWIGSQIRDMLADSGYRLIGRPAPGQVILEDDCGGHEVWVANDGHAGYTIQIGRWGYEFVTSLP